VVFEAFSETNSSDSVKETLQVEKPIYVIYLDSLAVHRKIVDMRCNLNRHLKKSERDGFLPREMVFQLQLSLKLQA